MKKYCLFDLDGTLMDSMATWGGTMLTILDEEKIDYPNDTIRIITPLGYQGTAKYFIKLGITKKEDELIERMYELAEKAYDTVIEAKQGVTEYIRALNKEGHSCNILTASPHRLTDACLKRNGIYDLFDNVWSIEDYSMTKDMPEIYFEAAKRMGCGIDEITFFDDNLIALQTAKSAGLEVIGVYDTYSESDIDAIKNCADKFISSFSELL